MMESVHKHVIMFVTFVIILPFGTKDELSSDVTKARCRKHDDEFTVIASDSF